MAHEPCSCCGQAFFGRSVLAYPAVVNGQERQGKRVRLSPAHAQGYIANMDRYLEQVTADKGTWQHMPEVCRFCGTIDLVEGTRWLFVTVYPQRNERRDYAGLACPGCSGRAVKEVLLDAS
jgi:hypothetical protein